MHGNLGQYDLGGQREIEGEAVAIVGMSCRFAGARGLDEFWQLLRSGKEAISTFSEDELVAAGVSPAQLKMPNYVRRGAPLADMECFDAALFGLSPRDAAIMDPQHRHFLECTWEAFENAGHVAGGGDGAIGVFAGSGHNAYMPYNLLTNPALVRDVGLFLLRHTGNDKDFLSTRVSYLFDLKGPSLNVQTACSTSLVAMHLAAQSLLAGECDMAVAGGASIEFPHNQGYVCEAGEILSPDGHCRPFDASSQGTVFGSGVAVVLLRRLSDAVADGDHIYAVMRGSAINNDGAGKVGYLAPSVDGQAGAISEALGMAGIGPDEIDYVEAHGTGTPVGDPIEIAALTEAFSQTAQEVGRCAIGSVKGNIGHTDTAAGLAGVIKVSLAMTYGELPPSLHFQSPNPDCGFEGSPFRVQSELSDWSTRIDRPRRAGVSSLGVGGTNAHVILEEAPPQKPGGASRAHHLLLMSGQSTSAADANVEQLTEFLAANPEAPLGDVAFTLSTGRRHLSYRRFAVGQGAPAAAAALAASRERKSAASACLPGREVAFLFCGAGPQHVDMGRGLYESEPGFRRHVDEGLEALARIGGPDVRRWMFPDTNDREQARFELERPSIALPALFILQTALARFWMSLGVRPTAMIGHSSGEYAAAHLSGVVDLGDALRIVSARGRLFETVERGAMVSVPMGEAELLPLLPPNLSIATINAPRLCVVSGPADPIACFQADLERRDIEAQAVPIRVAAHSSMLDPILPEFRNLLKSVRFNAPTIPFASNLTGQWVDAGLVANPEYWVRHLREPVRFTDGLQRLLGDEDRVLLEVGPGRGMASLARQNLGPERRQPVVSSMRHPDQPLDDEVVALEALGELWALGVTVDWTAFWAGEQRNRVPLPTYRFDRTRHWIEPGVLTAGAPADEGCYDRRELSDWRYAPVWSRASVSAPAADPAAAALVFLDQGPLGETIAARLEKQGTRVFRISAGSRFTLLAADHFALRPGHRPDYARLLEMLADTGISISQAFHCWLVSGQPRRSEDSLDLGFYSLMALAPELAGYAPDGAIDLAVVTDCAQRVCTEALVVPEKATAIGAAQVISTEYPNLRLRTIDVAIANAHSARHVNGLADALIGELAATWERRPIALREGERWVCDHQQVEPTEAGRRIARAMLRPGGTYVITGGLGGLGLAVARHLAGLGDTHLILISRKGLPPRRDWAELLAGRSLDSTTEERIRNVLVIEARGARVEILTVDVTDPRALRRALDATSRRLGPIRGVFHAAGSLDDALIETKSRPSMNAVLRPKVQGTRALEAALRKNPVEFIMLFSSVSAFAGIAGQADYAAANAFLDSYAQARRGDPATEVISVGWSQWAEVGMAARLSGNQGSALELPDDLGVAHPVAHPLLDRYHRLSSDEYVAAATLSPQRDWILDEHRLAEGGALLPGTAFLELARAAFNIANPGMMELTDVTFLRPFAVPDSSARDLRIHLRRRVGDDWRFVIVGRPAGAGQAAWLEHASGSACLRPANGEFPRLDLAAAMRHCDPEPRLFKPSPQMQFGPRWDNVARLRTGSNEALLELALPAQFRAELDELLLHPALLDFATAGAQSLIRDQDAEGVFFAPFSYGRITQYAPLTPELVSHVRLRSRPQGAELTPIFDVTIADGNGRVLVEVNEFTMIRIGDASILAEATRAPSPSKNGTERLVSALRFDPILPEEGLAILDRILAGPPRPHVIVSPYDLRGVIDQFRAPAKASMSPAAGNAADPPVNATERMIADLWSDLLGIADIGRNDDFFDLGGHSLLAVQFTNRLKRQCGHTLPLSALLESPTVAHLAGVIDPQGTAEEEPVPGERVAEQERGVVTIRPGGSDVPIFFIHDGLGETLLYRGLALRLDQSRPIYGIEPLRTSSAGFAHTRINEMASEYIMRIRATQPEGPYLLAGLCAGGVIAFEIARQLEDCGETVAFVGIIDAADVAARKRAFFNSRVRLMRLRTLMGERSPGIVVAELARRAWNLLCWEVQSRVKQLRDRRTVQQIRAANAIPDPATNARRNDIEFLKLYEVAHRLHRPIGTFASGSVVLFTASDVTGLPDDLPYKMIYSDVALGWGKRVAHDLAILSVPGGHGSALQEPYVGKLALAFQEAVDSAVAHTHRHPQAADPMGSPRPLSAAAA